MRPGTGLPRRRVWLRDLPGSAIAPGLRPGTDRAELAEDAGEVLQCDQGLLADRPASGRPVQDRSLASGKCHKGDLLPASALVDAWADRNLDHEDTLAQLTSACGWDSDAPGTLAVARSIYSHLPPRPAAFWLGTGRVDITHLHVSNWPLVRRTDLGAAAWSGAVTAAPDDSLAEAAPFRGLGRAQLLESALADG